MLIFSLDADSLLAPALAAELDTGLSAHEDRTFDDGEHKLRPLVDPRGDDVYVVASLHGGPRASPHDKLCALLMFLATLRDHGARRITAVVPYLAYARKDRRTKPFDPVTLRYLAQWIETAGADQVIALEAHNVAAFQNAFRRPTWHLEAHGLFDAIALRLAAHGPLAVVSPDPGGVKRAQLWRESLQAQLQQPVGFAMIDKRRSAGVVSASGLVAGDVAGATALVLDDLIASGTTMQFAAAALARAGAREVAVFAAHGLFTGAAPEVLADAAISRVVVSDSVPPFRLPAGSAVTAKLTVVPSAALFVQAIRECHQSWEG